MDDLKTDEQVVALIDEIKHRLKAGQHSAWGTGSMLGLQWCPG